MIATVNTPRVYVACLASYNAGILHGEWIDLDQDPDDVKADLIMMIQHSPTEGAEEWAIHDYDNMPDMGEWPDLDKLCAIGNAIADADEPDAFIAWLSGDSTRADHPENFREQFIGTYESKRDYAMQYADDTGLDIPEHLAGYFDWDAYARDLFFDLETAPCYGGIYVFDPHA